MSYDALIQQNTSYWTAQCFYFPKENTIKNIFKNSNFRHTKENTFNNFTALYNRQCVSHSFMFNSL